MAHVFIVNNQTLKIHLEYMFAGTGAQEYNCDFLIKDNTIHHSTERVLVGMIADILRIRVGDKILFYLQATNKNEGTFEVTEHPFVMNSEDHYLLDELGKNLTFRIKIKPSEVYKYGISERECLDYLEDINYPYEMCWSLIYRKLKANRGCTMITDYEYKKIMHKIKEKNNYEAINSEQFLSYDYSSNSIITTNNPKIYTGDKVEINVKRNLIKKIKKHKSFEVYLQAYILQNLEKISCLTENKKTIWIGNEVACGVGMQSIDLMFVQEDAEKIYINVCELKDEECYEAIFYQIYKYILWLKYYIVPTYTKPVVINPIIIAKDSDNSSDILRNINEKIVNKFEDLQFINEVKLVTFKLNEDELYFEEKKYN